MSDLDSFFAKKDKKKKKKAAVAISSTVGASASANKAAQSVPAPDAGAVGSVAEELNGVKISGEGEPVQSQSVPTTKKDDGWIEIEESKTAQVNTGGRTVAKIKRDPNPTFTSTSGGLNDESGEKKNTEAESGDANQDSEKFFGWKEGDEPVKKAEPEPEPEKPRVFRPRAWRAAGPDVKSSQQFPSLADAAKANAPEVPQSMKAAAIIAPNSNNTSNPNKLTSSLTSSTGRPRFINSKKK